MESIIIIIHKYAHTYTCPCSHTHTHGHTHIHIDTHAQKHKGIHWHRHTLGDTDAHADTHAHIDTDTHTQIQILLEHNESYIPTKRVNFARYPQLNCCYFSICIIMPSVVKRYSCWTANHIRCSNCIFCQNMTQ